mmetsp:Transcript_30404/g.71049  ORF Transcript_30404/g.71049 Transcript_30404/m.71049 type:complete len:279 (-) Transcript_30404:940-1776(-)
MESATVKASVTNVSQNCGFTPTSGKAKPDAISCTMRTNSVRALEISSSFASATSSSTSEAVTVGFSKTSLSSSLEIVAATSCPCMTNCEDSSNKMDRICVKKLPKASLMNSVKLSLSCAVVEKVMPYKVATSKMASKNSRETKAAPFSIGASSTMAVVPLASTGSSPRAKRCSCTCIMCASKIRSNARVAAPMAMDCNSSLLRAVVVAVAVAVAVSSSCNDSSFSLPSPRLFVGGWSCSRMYKVPTHSNISCMVLGGSRRSVSLSLCLLPSSRIIPFQ